MKHLSRICILLFLASVAVQFISCSGDTDCSNITRASMNVGFYKYANTAAKDTLDSLTIKALGTDSIIINKDIKVTSEKLPLRWTADSTQLIFHYANTTLKDTVTVYHTNTPTFVSMECGFAVAQSISKVKYTKAVMDSIAVIYKNANADDIQNIKIFY